MDGNEYEEATEFLRDYMKIPKLSAAVALEIGGSNGMINVRCIWVDAAILTSCRWCSAQRQDYLLLMAIVSRRMLF